MKFTEKYPYTFKNIIKTLINKINKMKKKIPKL